MSIERDEVFEQLEDIAAMMTENSGIEFENGKYVYYGLDARTAFAAVYISGAWAGWQAAKAESHKSASLYQWEINHLAAANQQWRGYAAKAQAVPEGFVLVSKDTLNKSLNPNDYDEAVCSANELLAVIEAQEKNQ